MLLSPWVDIDTTHRAVRENKCVVPTDCCLASLPCTHVDACEWSLLQPTPASLKDHTSGEICVIVCLSYGKISLKPIALG